LPIALTDRPYRAHLNTEDERDEARLTHCAKVATT
jgi:hypothetical protein